MAKQNKKQKVVEPVIDAASGLVVAGSALINPVLGVASAVIAPIFQDLSKRMLSPKEISRIDKVKELTTLKIQEELDRGTPLRSDLQGSGVEERIQELVEGTLLTARNSYEEKKLPLIANLCSRSLFTNTPIENMSQTLMIAERLSYRQLCIVSLYSKAEFGFSPTLLDEQARTKWNTDEYWLGVYNDLLYLIEENILVQAKDNVKHIVGTIGDIIPNLVRPTYLGSLLINGMLLDTIPTEDTQKVQEILSGNTS